MMIRVLILILLIGATTAESSTWWDVRLADAQMDLGRARSTALEVIEEDKGSIDAVAVAAWWLGTLDSIPNPGEILDRVAPPINPELSLILGLIESELGAVPPAGTLPDAEISGPWGTFGYLDLDRGVVPPDSKLPPPNSPWKGPGTHYRVRITTEDGQIDVPPSLHLGGVVLAAWTLQSPEAFDGYLVVEARGSYDLDVDGLAVNSIRFAGTADPAINWYRAKLGPGQHRLRVAMAPQSRASIRLSLFDTSGTPIILPRTDPDQEIRLPAPSTVTPGDPPTPGMIVDDTTKVQQLLCAAEVARFRGNTPLQKSLLDRALEIAPEEPLVHLSAGTFFLLQPTGEAPEIASGHSADHLRHCRSLPVTALVERLAATRQNRVEDAQRLQDQLLRDHPSDVRVLRLRITQAVHRGWPREAADALKKLETGLGPTEDVELLRLRVLQGLEHWTEYQNVLQSLADQSPLRRDLIGQLAEGCSTDVALALIDRLRLRVKDPGLDADRIRLLLRSERHDQAREALNEALKTWGALPDLRGLSLSLILGPAEFEDGLRNRQFTSTPLQVEFSADLDIMTLAWRRGALKEFWAPFQVEASDIIRSSSVSEEGVDAVLLLDQAVERVFPDGSSLYYYHGLSKALTRSGARQASSLEQMAGAVRIRMTIIKPDGRKIVPAKITPTSRGINLGEVEAGDIIEEEYVAEVSAVSPNVSAHLSPYVYRFADADRAFGLSEYVLLYPPEIDPEIDGLFAGLEMTTGNQGDLVFRRWRATNVPARPDEPFGPPVQELLPWVAYGVGTTWETVGDSLRDRLIPVVRSTSSLRLFAEEHLVGDNPTEQLRSLVSALLDSVKPGNSLLDLGSSASAALSRGQGNRLGILAATLLGADWKVDLCLSRPTPFAGTHLAVPSPDAFMMPLLRVRTGESEVWIDLQEENSGIGHISPILQGSDALMLPLDDPNSSVFLLSELPVFPNPNLEEHTVIEAVIEADGSAAVVFSMWLRDAQATRFSDNLRSVPPDQVDILFSRLASGVFPGAENVHGSVQNDGERLEVRFAMDLPNACTIQGAMMECRGLNATTPLTPLLASLADRKLPLILQSPILRREETIIRPPQGWSSHRSARRIATTWGSIEETMETTESGRHSILILQIPAVVVEPENYPEFARFCRAIDELASRPPRFEK